MCGQTLRRRRGACGQTLLRRRAAIIILIIPDAAIVIPDAVIIIPDAAIIRIIVSRGVRSGGRRGDRGLAVAARRPSVGGGERAPPPRPRALLLLLRFLSSVPEVCPRPPTPSPLHAPPPIAVRLRLTSID